MIVNEIRDIVDPIVFKSNYSKGISDWSVSDLIEPTQISYLKLVHEDKLKLIAIDSITIDNFVGNCVHAFMETSLKDKLKITSEERLFTSYRGHIFSGAIDVQRQTPYGIDIIDFKVTSLGRNDTAADWKIAKYEKQLNLYAYLLRLKNRPVRSLTIVAFNKDPFNNSSLRDCLSGYREWLKYIPIQLWDMDKQEAFFRERADMLIDAKESWPAPCTDEDMWTQPGVIKMINEKSGRSIKNYDIKDAPELAPDGYRLERTSPRRIRCERWCPVSEWCPQYAASKNDGGQKNSGVVQEVPM